MINPRLSIIPAGAVTDPLLEGRDLQVLALLGRHIDTDNGWCRRSQVRMAREIGCARSTVQASLTRLVAAGWVMTRVEARPGGGDTAHSYRVILDRDDGAAAVESIANPEETAPETPAAEGADLSAGVPAQDRHPVPIYASAPLTSPFNDKEEREARARAEEAAATDPGLSIDAAFAALLKVWPNVSGSSGALARSALSGLTGAERKLAVERVPAFLAFHRENFGKAKLPHLHNYVDPAEKHRWMSLPADKVGAGARKVIDAFGRAWWWLWFDFVDRAGARLADHRSAEATQLRNQVNLARSRVGWKVGPGKIAEIEAAAKAFVQIKVDGDEFAEWTRLLRLRGVELPRPDKVEWVWVPSQWPGDEREREARLRDEMAEMGR